VEKNYEYGYDSSSEALMQDPYPLYHKMQAECPVNHTQAFGGFWCVSNFEAVHAAAADFRTFSSTEGVGIPNSPVAPLYPIDLDPPLQTAYRKILNPRFTVEALEVWRKPFREEVNRLIDQFIRRGEVLLAKDLCQIAPLSVVLPLIGIPREGIDELKGWVATIIRYRSEPSRAIPAGQKIESYMMELVARRRTMPPQDDVVGDLLQAKVGGRELTDEDIYRTVTIVLFGGLDTTTAAMLEGARFMSAHPEEWRRLEADPSLWPGAVEEILRFSSPAQGMARTVHKDTVLEGVPLKVGDKVMLLFAAANHDPGKFENPDKLQIDRCPNEHMAFGSGAHVCLGRNLARLEVEEILKAIFRRMPDLKIRPDAKLEYHPSEARSLKELPSVFTPKG
jgi:cytochrome P450